MVLVFSLTACGKVSDHNESEILKVQNYNQVMKTGKVLVDPVHGEETDFWYGALSGVGETNANGVAYIHRFKDGTSVATMNLNILPVAKPQYFSVVLKNDLTGGTIDAGELSSIIGDARHSAKVETTADVSSHLRVVVLKHMTKGDAGTIVADGVLKKPQPPR